MDNLNYQYENNTNKLSYVTDQVSASAKDYDIDGQPFQNYTYDKIGNLVADKQESITSINWSVYGKIRGIIKRNTTTGKETSTQYGYDPSGNRTYKEVIRRDIGNHSQDIVDRTYYVRDAQGNTMATYTKHEEPGNTPNLKWAEQHLYGSSRIGVMNLNLDIPAQTTVPPVNQTLVDSLHTGEVMYELTNHLGNVMATISDKKLFSNIVIPETGAAAFYYPEVLSQTDYYAFGQEIKERSYRISGGYRYGFNGKENDGEIKGEGNQQDYGFRIYDPRLSRFLSVDPLVKEYPWYTPYQFAGNTPITAIDIDGLEPDKSLNTNEARVLPTPQTLSPNPTRIGPGGNLIKPYSPRPSVWGSGLKLLAGFASSPVGMTIAGVLIPSNAFEKSSESGWLENRDIDLRERAEDKYEEDHPNEQIRYVTYYKMRNNGDGSITRYSGRTSGPAKLTAEQIVQTRDKQHELSFNLPGFTPAIVDKEAVGGKFSPAAKWAIRGRELQLIDWSGGAQSDKNCTSANKIRGVSRINPMGLTYHTTSTIIFQKELHEFTGLKLPKLK